VRGSFQLLGRPELLEVFQENHRRMGEVLSALEALPGDTARGDAAGRLRQTAAELAAGVESGERRDMAQALGASGNCLEPEDNSLP